MMNDDILTLYYYDDGLTDRERHEVEAAIDSDAEVAARFRRLCAELDDLAARPIPVAPPHLAPRLHDILDRSTQQLTPARSKQSFHPGSFFWGAAVAASLTIGVAIGVFLTSETGSPALTASLPVEDSSTALSRGILVHFRDSRDVLASLDVSGNGERDQLIMNIVQQNRLFERMANQSDSQDLARVLRAFEPILIKLASKDISPDEAAKLQAQLAFELNIVLTKLMQQVSDNADAIDT